MKFKILIIFVSALLFSCRDMKEISVTDVDSFNINKITAQNIEAEIKLKINNPNTMGFSIYPSEFEIIFSGIHLGKAKLNKRVHLDAKSERVYTFKLNSKLSDLNPMDALRLLNIGNSGNIEIKGDLRAGKFYIKKKFPINYTDKVKLFK